MGTTRNLFEKSFWYKDLKSSFERLTGHLSSDVFNDMYDLALNEYRRTMREEHVDVLAERAKKREQGCVLKRVKGGLQMVRIFRQRAASALRKRAEYEVAFEAAYDMVTLYHLQKANSTSELTAWVALNTGLRMSEKWVEAYYNKTSVVGQCLWLAAEDAVKQKRAEYDY